MYKDEYDRKQSKNDVDQPRDKNANSGAVKAFHRYQLLLLLLQLHLCYLYHTHTSISFHPAVHQLTTAMLQTKYISLCLQHLAVNVMDRYGVCPCMWYILQLLTQWQHQYGQHTYQHSSLSANIPVCNTLLTEEIMPICKIYICASLLPSLIYVQNTNCSTLPSTRSAYTANAANYWPQQQIM